MDLDDMMTSHLSFNDDIIRVKLHQELPNELTGSFQMSVFKENNDTLVTMATMLHEL